MFGILHTDGSGENNPPIQALPNLYDEILIADQEHGDVSVINDDLGWSISAHRDGRVVLEHLGEAGSERHMLNVSKNDVISLWNKLINGDTEGLTSEHWISGYM